MNAAFWSGRKVFLTGHTGFKGSWAVTLLAELGADVTGFALAPPTSPALFDLIGAGSRCRDLRGDIRDREGLAAALREAEPDVVLHMAAQPLVRESYVNPVETYQVNVMGTVHLLDACRSVDSVRSVVVVTTDKCYQNNGWVWGYRENDRLGGADPYSNSKAACELVVDAYRQSYFSSEVKGAAHVASARAGNVIGGGDFAADRLIPDAVRAFGAGEPLLIRNPLSVRPWQHVLESLAGYLLLAERLHGSRRFADGWNFGPSPNDNAQVARVADLVAGHWGGVEWRQDDRYHPHEAATLKLDSTKARLELGWRPILGLEDAVRTTVDWYLGQRQGADVGQLTVGQVRDYLSALA